MYLHVVLVAILAFSGLAGELHRAQEPSATHDRVVGQATARVTGGAATPAGSDAPGGAPSDGVSLEQLDVIVPPVEASGAVTTPQETPETPTAAGVVVADQLVAPQRLESEVVPAAGFQTLGVTWPEDAEVSDLGGQVRTRTDGTWSDWVDLEVSDEAPDAGTPDAANAVRGGTDSVWIGDADAVQLAFAATATGGPDGLSLALIGSDEAPVPDGVVASSAPGEAIVRTAAFTTGLAQAATSAPRVISRAEWGAPAQVCAPDVAAGLVGAVVHHTADSNSYATTAQAMQQIRNDAVYHINTRKWCDIGYNFVVDKWGNIYEGRANSLTEAVIGVHTGGFNTGTVGVAMLGTYDAAPSAATQQAVARIIGWRLGAYGIDPRGSMRYSTGAGENSRYTNQDVTLPRVFGHRDTAFTACPGNGGHAALGSIRAMAWDALGPRQAFNLVRTAADPKVYLVTSSQKYPIDSFSTYLSLSVLGPLGYVSQSALDAKRSGPALGRFIRGRDGSLYLFDNGVRYPAPTCAIVAAFGRNCSEYGSMALTDSQVSSFALGPKLSTTVATTNGKRFVIAAGARREAATSGALASVGAAAAVTLREDAIANLRYGVPIVVGNAVATDRSSRARSVVVGTTRYPVANGLAEETALGRAFAAVTLDGASLRALTQGQAISGIVASKAGSRFVLTSAGKLALASGFSLGLPVTVVPDAVLGALRDVAVPAGPFFLKGAGSASVYVVSNGKKRAIDRMATVTALLERTKPFVYAVAGAAQVAALANGVPVLTPGSVVKSASSPDLYLVDGLDRSVRVPSMTMLARYRVASWSTVTAGVLAGYAVSSPKLSTAVRCGSAPFAVVNGASVALRGDGFGLSFRSLNGSTCSTLPRSSATILGPLFVKGVSSPIVYVVQNGVKRAVSSMAVLYALNAGNPSLTIVTMDNAEVAALG